jgi:glucokinase
MILAGDIGGTNARLALFQPGTGRMEPVASACIKSAGYPSLESVLDLFLDLHPAEVEAAAFGVAGPVVEGSSRITNLPWVIRQSSLAERLGTPRVRVLNDLAALALGLPLLRDTELETIQAGSDESRGHQAVIAAGTGLGEALLVRQDQDFLTVATEGGHVEFAPRDELEVKLWLWLRKRLPRVEYETVVSGPGLVNLYRFFHRDQSHADPWEDGADDAPAEAVSRAAMVGACAACRETLERFVSILGAEAGNLALKSMATGGVFVAGGIAPKILPVLRDGRFIDAFNDKGGFGDLTRSIPVQVVLNEETALLGAAHLAGRSLRH